MSQLSSQTAFTRHFPSERDGPSNHYPLREGRRKFPMSSRRLASTAPSIAAEISPQTNIPESTNAWDTPLDPDTSNPIANLEPHIGWLKELGLDFGWGPVSMMQWYLEHIYVYSGLPWAGAAILATILTRVLLFRKYLDAADMSARNATLTPVLAPLNERLRASRRNKDQGEMLEAYRMIQATKQKYGIKIRTMFVPMLIQMPIGYATFRLTRKMAALPVPGLDGSHFFWVSDLTQADPTFILPILSSALIYFVGKVSTISRFYVHLTYWSSLERW